MEAMDGRERRHAQRAGPSRPSMASGALGLLPIGRGDGGEAADCVGGLSRPSMAFEALGLLPGVTLSPTPPPSRGRGLNCTTTEEH